VHLVGRRGSRGFPWRPSIASYLLKGGAGRAGEEKGGKAKDPNRHLSTKSWIRERDCETAEARRSVKPGGVLDQTMPEGETSWGNFPQPTCGILEAIKGRTSTTGQEQGKISSKGLRGLVHKEKEPSLGMHPLNGEMRRYTQSPWYRNKV